MFKTRTVWLVLLIAFAFGLNGCQKKAGPQAPTPAAGGSAPAAGPQDTGEPTGSPLLEEADLAYLEGRYAAAAQAYEAGLDATPEHEAKEQILFRLGLIYLLPGETYQPERAVTILELLQNEYPDGELVPFVPLLLSLQSQIAALREQGLEKEKKIADLTEQLERLKEIDLKRKPPR